MEDIRIRLGNRIRTLRKELNLSQEALSLKAGLDRTYIASVESGIRNVSIANIERLATALKVSIETFFTAEDFREVRDMPSLNKVAERKKNDYRY